MQRSPPGWPNEAQTRVPAALYSQPGIYELERERIFRGKTWHYVGLATELPSPGDFIRAFVGDVPVVVVRDDQGDIDVFVNRCTHRGAEVCLSQRGNTKVFTCPYHQWSFNLNGKLVGIPFRRGIKGKGGMAAGFQAQDHNLEALQVAQRYGVIFASFSRDVEPLEDYLGVTACKYVDRVCAKGELRVLGKMQHRVHANWKLQVENLKDPFHAALLHSFFVTFGIWRSDQSTEVLVDPSGRHSVLLSTATFKDCEDEASVESNQGRMGAQLEDKRLVDYHNEHEHGTGAVTTIWPNLILLQQLNCLAMRHVRPAGPNACVKTWTFFGYESDPPELRRARLTQMNLLGPSGLVTIDDNEVLASVQEVAEALPGRNSVLEAGEGTGDADHMMTESAIRAFYTYYRSIMDDQLYA